jgi:hypothetical protein
MVVLLLGVYPVDLIQISVPPVKVSIVHILVTFIGFSAVKPQIKQVLSAGKECKQCLQIAEFHLRSSMSLPTYTILLSINPKFRILQNSTWKWSAAQFFGQPQASWLCIQYYPIKSRHVPAKRLASLW